jgi:arylsulfatase A-like enzyme
LNLGWVSRLDSDFEAEMIRSFAVLLILLSLASGGLRCLADERPPNFVLIFIDDMGYGDVGCYGGKRGPTPNIDRMAKQGIRFTDFHCAAAVCSSSRASLLAGCYCQRVSVFGALSDRDRIGIHPSEVLISELLKDRGYATAIFGKWHLGHLPDFLPLRNGFDEYFGLPYSNDMAPIDEQKKKRYPDLPLIEQDKTIEYNPNQNLLTTQYTKRAVSFIERNREKPFFLYLPHTMVHVPLGVSERFRGKSGVDLYGDVLMEVDWSVGQVLAALKRCGIDDETLVLFTSDNGPWLQYGDHAGTSGNLREGKATTWEGGQRVPCIARWPGKIPAGQTCNEFATTMDVLPTLAKLAGAAVPTDRIIDGHDIWQLLTGKPEAKSPYRAFYHYWNNNLEAVRSGPWKLVFPHPYPKLDGPAGSGGTSKPYARGFTELALFNLSDDVGETRNVLNDHPQVVKQLQEYAEMARDDLGDSLTKRPGKNVRPHGVAK